MPRRPILIAGPTASGKSALAVALAREVGGLVINADSMQVYDGLRILTARPSDEELAQAPHALYGHVPPSHAYSVAQWLADVAPSAGRSAGGRASSDHRRRHGPLFQGVAGRAVAGAASARRRSRNIGGPKQRAWAQAALHAILAERDPIMATRLSPTDPQRITRALEVLDATGLSLAGWQAIKGQPVLRADDVHCLCLRPPRAWLQARCDQRFDQMMAWGALDEVRGLAGLALDSKLPVMGALGVRPLLRHLEGESSIEAAVADGKSETRRYIKRQETWFNKYIITWISINLEQYANLNDFIAHFVRNVN